MFYYIFQINVKSEWAMVNGQCSMFNTISDSWYPCICCPKVSLTQVSDTGFRRYTPNRHKLHNPT
jgi:hypothetical protein